MIVDLPSVIFFATCMVMFCVHLRYQIPFYRASRRLDEQLRKEGLRSFVRDNRLKWRMFRNPSVIFNDRDSPTTHDLKQEVVDRWQAILRQSFPRIVWIGVIGLVLTFIGM